MATIRFLLCISAVAATPSCPADVQPSMLVGEGKDGKGNPRQRPSLLQTASPRRLSSGPVGEEVESPEVPQQQEQQLEATAAMALSTAAAMSQTEQGLAELPLQSSALSSLAFQKPFAALAGDFANPKRFLPLAVMASLLLSCSLVACMVASYRPRRRKLDEQFEPVRLGLPADYGLSPKMRTNCC